MVSMSLDDWTSELFACLHNKITLVSPLFHLLLLYFHSFDTQLHLSTTCLLQIFSNDALTLLHLINLSLLADELPFD